MAGTTLLEFVTASRDRQQAAVASAQTELAAAQASERSAREALDAHAAEYERHRATVVDVRRQLAEIPAPVDGDPLLEELREAIVNLRQELVAMYAAQEAADMAAARGARATRQLERARRRLADAERELTAAEAQAGKRAEWTAALGEPPLASLPADAEALLDGPEYGALRDGIEAAIPDKLRSSAFKRRALALRRLQYARELTGFLTSQLDAELQLTGGIDGMPAPGRTFLRVKEVAFQDFVQRAKSQLDRAAAFIAEPAPTLTAAEAQALIDLAADGAGAATKEEALTTAQIEVERTRLELTKAQLLASADPDADPAVLADAEHEYDDAVAERDAAQAEFDPLTQADLDRWQLVVPDPVWRHFLEFLQVTEILETLRDTTPAALDAELGDAETDQLTPALLLATEARRRRELWEDQLVEATHWRRALENGRTTRVFSAIRGDG